MASQQVKSKLENIHKELYSFRTTILDEMKSKGVNSEDIVYLSFLTVLGSYLFLLFLERDPLYHWDEGIYAESALNMIKEGYWLTPHIEGGEPLHLIPFLGKPPLVQWMQAISMMVLGMTKQAVRFPSALSALLTSIVIYFFGRDVYNRRAGLFSSIVFLSTPFIFHGFNMARDASLDTTLMFFGTLSVYYIYKAFESEKFEFLYYSAFFGSLGFMTKSLAVMTYPLAVLPLVLANYRFFKTSKTLFVTFIGLITSLPWYVYSYINYPQQSVDQLIFVEIINRIQISPSYETGTTFSFMKYNYFQSLPNMVDPWLYFLIPLVFALLYAKLRGKKVLNKSGFFLWWFTTTLILFVALGNHSWYIAPVMAPLALLIGGFIEKLNRKNDKLLLITYLTGFILSLAFSIRMKNISPFVPPLEGWIGFYDTHSGIRFLSTLSIFTLILILDKHIKQFTRIVFRIDIDVDSILLGFALILLVLSLQTFPHLQITDQGLGFDSQNRANVEEEMAEELNKIMNRNNTLYVSEHVHNNEMTNFAFFLEPSLQEWNQTKQKPAYLLVKNNETLGEDYEIVYSDRRNDRTAHMRKQSK